MIIIQATGPYIGSRGELFAIGKNRKFYEFGEGTIEKQPVTELKGLIDISHNIRAKETR